MGRLSGWLTAESLDCVVWDTDDAIEENGRISRVEWGKEEKVRRKCECRWTGRRN